jgi:histidinol phosphatase-like enzyme (inositol monophosphatase family)
VTAAFDLDRIGGRRALDALVSAVLDAGDEARRMFERGQAHVTVKPDRSPVTAADRFVEDTLRAFLAKAHPSVGFLGEETGASGPSDGMRFVLDPIDGTRAFVRGLTTWSVLLGLEADGLPSIGVAYVPAERDLFVAVRGGGAYDNGRPCRVSAIATLADATITHGSLGQFAENGLSHLLPRLGARTNARGLSDFDGYRNVLRGRLDAMIDPGVKPWDLCAPAVLVREAGGRLTSLAGDDTIHGGSALGSNGRIHAELLALLAEGDQPR